MIARCFIDTTYLMPLFGLNPSIQHLNDQLLQILRLDRFTFLYSAVSLIEIKWQVMHLGKHGHAIDQLERQFSLALSSLKIDPRHECVDFLNADINDLSYELRKLGHNDYFDTIIASSALWEAEIFITEDAPLKKVCQKYIESNQSSEIKKIEILDWNAFHVKYS
ncbi:MAG: hypothetical protein RBG13Loki_4198 [Promethearchaeota archaeon CR_4]|nr:MAG: hypothetical protein RBG13Loki_4198 [Candidatus Lokiarchaeota archaeon CR_4]